MSRTRRFRSSFFFVRSAVEDGLQERIVGILRIVQDVTFRSVLGRSSSGIRGIEVLLTVPAAQMPLVRVARPHAVSAAHLSSLPGPSWADP